MTHASRFCEQQVSPTHTEVPFKDHSRALIRFLKRVNFLEKIRASTCTGESKLSPSALCIGKLVASEILENEASSYLSFMSFLGSNWISITLVPSKFRSLQGVEFFPDTLQA